MYDLKILVGGNPVKKYFDKDGRIWIEAREGTKYELRISSDSWNKTLAVVSVDGLNIINGKHEDPNTARGYILNSRYAATIPGWKTGPNSVREFYFTTQNDSFSKKIGADERNTGVIAAAFFTEKFHFNYNYVNTWTVYDQPTIYNTNMSSSLTDNAGSFGEMGVLRQASVASFASTVSEYPEQKDTKLATGSGASLEYKTHNEDFNRGDMVSMITIYYDSLDGLRKRGILADDKEYREYPKAFPSGEYCPDV